MRKKRKISTPKSVSHEKEMFEREPRLDRGHEKLRRTQAMLIQAEKMSSLGQIAAGVVHELNNPLTAIDVYSESLITKTGTPEEDLTKLQQIIALKFFGFSLSQIKTMLQKKQNPQYESRLA